MRHFALAAPTIAGVTVNFADMDLGVASTRIASMESRETYDDITWEGIAIRDGTFETPTLSGRFFGPNHEEVGQEQRHRLVRRCTMSLDRLQRDPARSASDWSREEDTGRRGGYTGES